MQGEPSPPAKAICGSGGGPLKLKHPHGAVGNFSVKDTRHRQANNYYTTVMFNCEASIGLEPLNPGNPGYNPATYVEIRHSRALSVTSKKITLSSSEELEWTFDYEEDDVCGIMGVPCGQTTGYIEIIHSPANLYYSNHVANGYTGQYKSDEAYTSSGDDPIDYTNWTKVTDPENSIMTYFLSLIHI